MLKKVLGDTAGCLFLFYILTPNVQCMSKRPFEPGKEPIPTPGEIPEIEPTREPYTDPRPQREPEIIPWDPQEDPDRIEPPEEMPPRPVPER